MKSSGNPPPAPDPTTSANAQSQANIATAIANARLNRVNQTTPWGSLTYTQTGVDANGIPIYESHIALSPQQQALLEAQQHGSLTRSNTANSLLDAASGSLSHPLSFSGLQSVYDPYSANHQWQMPTYGDQSSGPGASSSPPPPSSPGASGPGASAPGAPGPASSGSNIQALVAALRSGQSSSPQGQPAAAQAAPASGDPYGTWGNLNSMIGTTKPDTSKLPPEIAAQLQDNVSVDEGGTQSHNYSFNENPWGGYRDPTDGKYYVQVGDPASNNASDGGIKDKSKVVYKPGAGYVTTPDNLNDHGTGGIDWRMVAAVVGAGAGGAAMGLGADAAGGAGGTMTGLAGDESLGLAGTGTYGGATGATGALPGAGIGADESAGLSMGNSAAPAAAGNYAPVTDLSVQAQQPSMLQQMLTNMQQGRGALGYGNNTTRIGGSLLSQLLRNNGAKK